MCLEQQDTGRWPHQFPELWRQHVESKARQILANGWNVIWEPWNEPDYWPGSDKPNDQDLAFRQYLEAFRDSYRIIRKMDPHARFSGPSLSADASIGWTASKRRIEQFLAFCDQHQIEVADLTWHGFDDSKIFNYPDRLREIRQLAAQKYPAVRVQRILISEIVSENYFESPGDLIATLKYLDDADVDLVSRACWGDTCWLPTLAGSVRKNDVGKFQTTALWWANFWYASLRGTRYSGVSSEPGIAAMAVLGASRIAVLLGFSRAAGPVGPKDIVLRIKGGPDAAGHMIEVKRISEPPPLASKFMEAPISVRDFEIKTNDSQIVIKLPRTAPGDSFLILL